MSEPYSMSDNRTFQCPLSGKKFEFVLRDNASRQGAFARQQQHTANESQRLTRKAGRQLTYRELLKSAQREQAAARAAEMNAAEEAVRKTQEPHPLVEAILCCSTVR